MKQLNQIEEFIKSTGIVDNTNNPKYLKTLEKLNMNGSKVFHVIEDDYWLGYEKVHMVNYCLYTKEDYSTKYDLQMFIENFNDGYIFSFVVNETWSIEEYGSIACERNGENLVRLG